MIDKKEFHGIIQSIDGKPQSEFAKMVGDFDFTRYVVRVGPETSGQEIPLTVKIPQIIAGFPEDLFDTPVRRMALEDYLVRNLALFLEELSDFDENGVAYRHLSVAVPGQKILPRTSMVVLEDYIEAHIKLRLPARNGLIAGGELEAVFFDEIQEAVNNSFIFCNLDYDELNAFLDIMEDAGKVRQLLPSQGLVSFIGEDALLERDIDSDLPADFQADLEVGEDLAIDLDVPNSGEISGLGIKDGITLILGNEYSGRTDLMNAIANGIYNHAPGDGREFVASAPDTVYIRQEPGRSIQKVDLSAFIKTEDSEFVSEFSTACANGFESQAAGLVESLEVGARVLLFDEASSAPSFLSGDSRLKDLVDKGETRIVPLAARARQMVEELGVSLVVAGTSNLSEFVPIADTVLLIDDFQVRDITEEAKAVGIEPPQVEESPRGFAELVDRKRWVVPSSIDPSSGIEDAHIMTYDKHILEFGRNIIDLRSISQIADEYQTRTIGQVLYYLKLRYLGTSDALNNVLDYIDQDLSTDGLRCLSPDYHADLARPRRYEIAAALNRLPTFRIEGLREATR